ncbi:MAG TPA: BlaI/MecI/CopY family transcriptional regulator [Longimicrobium sp.]|jgi:predicted transcriptional regulator|uniref:BlaI/MecI/CopY family transcriptional regulator n=1 Tax=Longimicrobium sp. TaxID=2029185 RepID=UPI002EDBB7FD
MREAYRDLTRRERQIMDSVYRRGSATAADVLADLPEPPSYSAVRAMLRKLQDKGYLLATQDGPRYLYAAVIPRDEARESALHRLVRTFFDGSRAKAVAALLDPDEGALSEDEMRELEELIRRQKEGK